MVEPSTKRKAQAVVDNDYLKVRLVRLDVDRDTRGMPVFERVAHAFVNHQPQRLLDRPRQRDVDRHHAQCDRDLPLGRKPRAHLGQPHGDRVGFRDAVRGRPELVDEQAQLALFRRERAFEGAKAIGHRSRRVGDRLELEANAGQGLKHAVVEIP